MDTIGLRLPAPRQAHLTCQSIVIVKFDAMLDGLTCPTKAPAQAGAALIASVRRLLPKVYT
ncbi:MAG: hypothetical protein EBT90_04985 [Rhodobacteraceae bacterium]|nr:hypothetical protein [Paracoccaceae bacterium]